MLSDSWVREIRGGLVSTHLGCPHWPSTGHADSPVASVSPDLAERPGGQRSLKRCVCELPVLQEFHVSFIFKDGKIEAEDFTSRLYRELNSSPQPYLVPFLKVTAKPLSNSVLF